MTSDIRSAGRDQSWRATESQVAEAPKQAPYNNALQLTSGGLLARALRAPSLSRRSQLNAVLDGHDRRTSNEMATC